MDEEEDSENGREESEEEEDDDDNEGDEDRDANENQAEIDRRVASLLESGHQYLQMCDTSAQILQMLSQFMPVVPQNTQVVELESISDESDDSMSTPRSGITDTPPSRSEDNSECVIWAEPIMSCQILPMWTPPCDDVRRLPPGVRPEDVKRMNSARGRGAGTRGGIGVGRGGGQPLYRPGQWSGCLTSTDPARRPAQTDSDNKNTTHNFIDGPCGSRPETGSTQTEKSKDVQSSRPAAQRTTSLIVTATATAVAPPSISRTSATSATTTTTTTTAAATAVPGSSGDSLRGPGLHDIGGTQFGLTHNDFNDAMLKISSAADTIRQARLLLASVNSTTSTNTATTTATTTVTTITAQGRNNNNPENPCELEGGGQDGDSANNEVANKSKSSTHSKTPPAALGDQANNSAAENKQMSPRTQPGQEQTGAHVEVSPKENFREPILVKSASPQPDDKPSPSRLRREEDSTTVTMAENSMASTVAELNSIPTDSGITRGRESQSSNFSSGTFSRHPTLSLHSRLSGCLPRRSANQCRTPWSLRMTPSEYQAARMARCPRLYGPLARPSRSPAMSTLVNRNRQSTLLGSAMQDSPVVPPLIEGRASPTSSAPVRSSANQQLTVSGSAVSSAGSVVQHCAGQDKVKQKITLEDLRRALDIALKKLNKSDGWTSEQGNVPSDLGQGIGNSGASNEDDVGKSTHTVEQDQSRETHDSAEIAMGFGSGDGLQLIQIATEVEKISIIQQELLDEIVAAETVKQQELEDTKKETEEKIVDCTEESPTGSSASRTQCREPPAMSAVRDQSEGQTNVCAKKVAIKAPVKFNSIPKLVTADTETQTEPVRKSVVAERSPRLARADSDPCSDGQGETGGINDKHEETPQSRSFAQSATPSMSSYRDTLASIESYHEEIQLSPSELAIYQKNYCEYTSIPSGERILWPSKRGWVSGHSRAHRKGHHGRRDVETSTCGRRRFSCIHRGGSGPDTGSSEVSDVDNDVEEEASDDAVTMKSESVGTSISSTLRKFAFIRRKARRPISYQDLCKKLEEEKKLDASKEAEGEGESAANVKAAKEDETAVPAKSIEDEIEVAVSSKDKSVVSAQVMEDDQATSSKSSRDGKIIPSELTTDEDILLSNSTETKEAVPLKPAESDTIVSVDDMADKEVTVSGSLSDNQKAPRATCAKEEHLMTFKPTEMGDILVYNLIEEEKVPVDKAGGDMKEDLNCLSGYYHPDEHEPGVYVTNQGTCLKTILLGDKGKATRTPPSSMETSQDTASVSAEPDEQPVQPVQQPVMSVKPRHKSLPLPEDSLTSTVSRTELRPASVINRPATPQPPDLDVSMSPSPVPSSLCPSATQLATQVSESSPETQTLAQPLLEPTREPMREERQKVGFRERLRRFFSRCFRVFAS